MTGVAGWAQGQSAWPIAAVQDSVAAIVRQRVYQRSIRTTLLDRLFDWIGALFQRLFSSINAVPHAKWIILGLGIAAVLAISGRIWLGSETEARRRRARAGSIHGTEDPWADAERLASAGNYTDAAHLLYRGLTERLAAGGHIHLHQSKTSGDYARELRTRSHPAHNEFRQFGRRYDHVIFGTGTCDAATYAALREHATRLVRLEARAA